MYSQAQCTAGSQTTAILEPEARLFPQDLHPRRVAGGDQGALICICFFFFIIFIYLTVLGLCCCTGVFSSCGYSPVSVRGLLIVVASLVVEKRL